MEEYDPFAFVDSSAFFPPPPSPEQVQARKHQAEWAEMMGPRVVLANYLENGTVSDRTRTSYIRRIYLGGPASTVKSTDDPRMHDIRPWGERHDRDIRVPLLPWEYRYLCRHADCQTTTGPRT